MDVLKELRHEIQKLWFLKTVQRNSFAKLMPAACNFKNNAQETYLFVTDLCFCHLYVISLLTLSSIPIEGEQFGKIKQNKLDCCDTVDTIIIPLFAHETEGKCFLSILAFYSFVRSFSLLN